MAERAQVGYARTRTTVVDMVRAGELVAVGTEVMPHSRRPMTLYAPAPSGPINPTAPASPGTVPLLPGPHPLWGWMQPGTTAQT